MKRIVLPLLMLAAAPVSHAQEASEFERHALAIANACLAGGSTAEAAPSTVAACEKMIVDLDTLKSAAPSVAGHDVNVYLVVRGMGLTRIASSYGRLDGVRSARVCQRTEDAWENTSQIQAANSPNYADMIRNLVTQTSSAIATCRSEFGVPAGAPPLP